MDQLSKLNKQEEGEFIAKKVSYMIQAIQGALPKETVKNFGKLESDSKQFSFAWNLQEVQDVMVLEKEYEEKSAELAKAHREKGNTYFQKKSYLTALGEYSMGVITAPWNYSRAERNAATETTEQVACTVNNNSAESQTDSFNDSQTKEGVTAAQNSGENTSADKEGNRKVLVEQNTAEKEEPKNELALAFANRSAALFHLKKYRECLEDIRLAIEAGYPKESCYKLYERRGCCYVELGNPEAAVSSFKLAQESLAVAQLDEKARTNWSKTLCKHLDQSKKTDLEKTSEDTAVERTAVPRITGGASSSHPDVSANVRICYGDRTGRHVIAGQDIKAGDVLMVDKPFASVLFPRFHKTHCYHCFVQVLVPIPCVQCTSVIYCSQQCRDASWTKFHKHECEFFALLDVSMCAKIGHLAVRLLMVVGLSEALEFVEQHKVNKTPPSLEFVGLNKDGVYSSEYGTVYDMAAHSRSRPAEQLLGFSVFSCLLMKILKLSGYVQAPENSSEFVETGGLLLHHLQVIQCNGKRIVELQQPNRFDDTKPEELGIGIYPSVALLNHSCDPTADLSSFGNSMVVRAMRNINEGEEIAISYGPLFYETKELRRQAELKEAYFFSCRCPACKEHWPVLEEMFDEVPRYSCGNCRANLSIEDKFERKYYKCPKCQYKQDMEEVVGQLQSSFDEFAKAMNDAMSGHSDEALPVFIQHLLLLQRYIRQPWRDFCSCQLAVRQCFRLLANKKS